MQLIENKSLKSLNSFGIDATAAHFAEFENVETLGQLLEENSHLTHLVLGGGSNLLLTRNFAGLVLKNAISGIRVLRDDDEHVYIEAGAGENWHRFVLFCIDHNWSGVENLSLIPGNVGASPMQNIGAYGVEIKDVFHSLEAFDKESGKVVSFSKDDCEFGYRESVFKNRYKGRFVIVRVTYRLRKTNHHFNTSYGAIEQELERMGVKDISVKAISDAVIHIRRSKLPDPSEIGNAGSFFKNPEISADTYQQLHTAFPNIVAYPLNGGGYKLAAGWLIEQCGWKGYRKGDAGCHAKQALVLVNYGHAKGSEIYELSESILQSVKNKFGVLLEREVNII